MTVILTTLTIIILAFLAIILFARIVVRATYDGGRGILSITLLGCGPALDMTADEFGVQLGPWRHFFRRRAKKAADESGQKVTDTPAPKAIKSRRRFPFGAGIQIGKAFVVMIARLLARVKYEGGKLEARPVFANPALAGMAYGWSQSLYGMFPAFRETVDFVPEFVEGNEYWSGDITFSIKNRQIAYVMGRFLIDLPLRKIVRHFIARKVQHG